MQVIRWFVLNSLAFAALIIGGLGIGEYANLASNFFVGITVFQLIVTLICLPVLFSEEIASEFGKNYAEQNKKPFTRSVPQKVDFFVDLALILGSFTLGFWFSGLMWIILLFLGPVLLERLEVVTSGIYAQDA